MSRLWITVFAAVAALGIVPAAAQADTSSTNITSWTSTGQDGTRTNASYLTSYDNPGPTTPEGTTLTVSGTATGVSSVDIVCYYGAGSSAGFKVLHSSVPVSADGTFTGSDALLNIVKQGAHACRLRAIPNGEESTGDSPQYAGPQVAISEAALPSFAIDNKPYDFVVNGMTFSGTAGWDSAGTCGPFAAPVDSALGTGNFAIDCWGSLLGSNMPLSGTRSEVQVDGQNAYDAASVQALFNGTENTAHFPSLAVAAGWDPTTGLVSSRSDEGLVVCPGLAAYPPSSSNCPDFASAGVHLERDVTMSDGGLVVTMTDTWSSVDGRSHSLDLLYDDFVGLHGSTAQRGYRFPGQSAFTAYGQGATLPGPGAGPGSIFVRTNLAAADGDPTEADGSITFSTPPTDFVFAANNELEEHQVLQVPAGGDVQLTYVYSTDYTLTSVAGLALAAQDRLERPAVAITSPAYGTAVSTPSVTVTGTATAGSGITSLVVAGQAAPVAPGGTWSATVPLSLGSNTITALATDAAGGTAQAQVVVVYQTPPGPPPPPAVTCNVPRIAGLKLETAKRTLRQAHCRAGEIRYVRSRQIAKGRVVNTSPRAGRGRPAGSKVELFVSKGR